MARALPFPLESVLLVRSLDTNLMERALTGCNPPATVLVVEGSLKDLPVPLSSKLEASRGDSADDGPTFKDNEDGGIGAVKETEGGFCLVGNDGAPVTPTFKHVVCAPGTMESPLAKLLRTPSNNGSGAPIEDSGTPRSCSSLGANLGVYVSATEEELAEWMDLEEWEFESHRDLARARALPAAAAEGEIDDDEDELQPRSLSLQQTQNLLRLMRIVEEDGGADGESAKEAGELADRLRHICNSDEAATLSADDVGFVHDYVGEYIRRLDEKSGRLSAGRNSDQEEWLISHKIWRAVSLMGPLIQVRHEGNSSQRLTRTEVEQLQIHNEPYEGGPGA